MNVNDQFILDIKRLGINGEGIGFYNKMAVFVPNAIPGEGHNVTITNINGKMAFAKSSEIKHESNDRVEPKCPYYNECGGCNTMHINYDKMLDFKRDLIIESINRYTKLNPKQFEIHQVARSNPYNYRNKSQLQVRQYSDGIHVCMFKENSNITIPIDNCLIQNSRINDLNTDILKLMEELKIMPYNHKNKEGIIRFITIRVNKNDESLVTLVCYKHSDEINILAKKILKLDGVKGVYENINSNLKDNNILGDNTTHLCGDEYIIETLGNVKYQIYPTTFFQLNSNQAEVLYNLVLKAAKLSRKEVVLDAYCGVGSIGLFVAKMAKEVIGIENNKESILAANNNAKLNKISNTKFYEGDATKVLPKLIDKGIKFDVIIVDPPRTGLTDEFIKTLLETNVKKIVYVSCNPSTLAKNLDLLSSKYKVMSIAPVDMFPQTALVESVCSLLLKEQKN